MNTGTQHVRRVLGRPKRLIALVAGLFVLAVYAAAPAFAVHDETFQLDGNVLTSPDTNVGGHTQTLDWQDLFTTAGGEVDPLPADFTASGFERDFGLNPGCSLTATTGTFCTSDDTTFATGSKDTLPITPGWQCNHDSNVNSKIDIMNAYAGAYTSPFSGDEILYFGLERNTNTGDANVGFWFLQDQVSCSSEAGTHAFAGDHLDGDLLIVSAFTNGGSVSTIDVYRWDRFTGTCPGVTCVINPDGVPGSLNPTPVAHGVDCRAAGTPNGDPACAVANTAPITTPWLTAAKTLNPPVGHNLPTAQFFEGGLNLTDKNLGDRCFNTFTGDTRSSQSLTATLFDFSLGVLGECTSTTETTPVDNAGNPIPAGGLTIPTDPNDAAILVKDKATVTVTGVDTFTGTLSFSLCGPFTAASTTTCDSGGVAVSSQEVTATGTYTSDAATVTEAGRYCWRADFTGDSSVGVPPSHDSRASECFTVNPVKPTLTTLAGAGPVNFGQPVTDTATLTGTAHKKGTGGPTGSTDGSIDPATLGGDATGTITFSLYKNSTCTTLATGSGTNPQTVDVHGDGSYGPVSFTPDAPGTYHWVASYSGDLPNTQASDASACLDENEDVVVRQIPTEIKTKQSWIPNDTATVTSTIGNLAAGGTVVFSLYDNATCSGTALFSQSRSIAGGAPSEEVSTNNTSFTITTGYTDASGSVAGPYSWKVVYTPAAGDTAHTGKQSSCDAEHFAVTYTNDAGPGSALP